MAKALRDLPALLRDVDLVLEARDARLPLTSVNPALDEAVESAWGGQSHAGPSGSASGPAGGQVGRRGRKRKVVVYTKRDLAERRFEQVDSWLGAACACSSSFFADDHRVRSTA